MDAIESDDKWRDADAIAKGDGAEVDALFALAYDELRTIARRQLARLNPGQTLSPTALVHDVYVRLADRSAPHLRNELHFRALAARVMRQVIVDHLRRRRAGKRGAGVPLQQLLSDVANPGGSPVEDLLAVDEALLELTALDPRQAQIVELRFFGGFEVAEVADLIGLSERTVKREWQKARAFLHAALHAADVAQ
jgi:RNA polymerase sigma factor (TIGR02999 family)